MTEQPEKKPMTIEEFNTWFDNVQVAFSSSELYMLIKFEKGTLNLLSCAKSREDMMLLPQTQPPNYMG